MAKRRLKPPDVRQQSGEQVAGWLELVWEYYEFCKTLKDPKSEDQRYALTTFARRYPDDPTHSRELDEWYAAHPGWPIQRGDRLDLAWHHDDFGAPREMAVDG